MMDSLRALAGYSRLPETFVHWTIWSRILLWITMLYIYISMTNGQCLHITESVFTPGRYRSGLTFKQLPVPLTYFCAQECLQRRLCHSFNYFSHNSTCQLNLEPEGPEVNQPLSLGVGVVYGTAQSIYYKIAASCVNHTCPPGSVCIPVSQSPVCNDSIDVFTPCGSPNSIPFTIHTTTGENFGDVATYSCLPGFNQSGETEAVCRFNGLWTVPSIQCTSSTTTTTSSGNGGGAITTTATGGSVANTGSGSTTLATSSGDCGEPPNIQGTNKSYTTTSVGSTVTYSCQAGWDPSSSSPLTLTCQSNAVWSAYSLTPCSPTECTFRLANGRYVYTGSLKESELGKTCKFFTTSQSRFKTIDHFPFDETMDDVANNCRPTGTGDNAHKPWCYDRTVFGILAWSYCEVPVCSN